MSEPSQPILLEAGEPHAIDHRSILSLAWPVILTNLLTTAVQWVDLFMVARLGKETVAAVGLASFLTTLIWAVLTAVQTGTQILVAQAYGAGTRRLIDTTVQLALLIGSVIALAVAVVLNLPGNDLVFRAFLAFDTELIVAEIGASYLAITLLVLPAMLVSLVGQAALRAVGDTRTPLWLTGAANVLNAALNYALIFGKWGAPELGVIGAAWGTVGARSVEALAYLVLLYSGQLKVALRLSRFRFDVATIARLFRLGIPTALEQLVITTGLLIYQRVMASYGTEALAGYQVGVILLQASFMPGFGLSVAATTLVGQWMGAGQSATARIAGDRCRNLAVLLMSALGVVFIIIARPFATLVLPDESVVPIAVGFIWVLACAQPAMAAHFALGGALRGAGEVRSPLIGALLSMYVGRLPISLLAAFVFEGPILYAFVGMFLSHLLHAAFLWWRWRSGSWQLLATAA